MVDGIEAAEKSRSASAKTQPLATNFHRSVWILNPEKSSFFAMLRPVGSLICQRETRSKVVFSYWWMTILSMISVRKGSLDVGRQFWIFFCKSLIRSSECNIVDDSIHSASLGLITFLMMCYSIFLFPINLLVHKMRNPTQWSSLCQFLYSLFCYVLRQVCW